VSRVDDRRYPFGMGRPAGPRHPRVHRDRHGRGLRGPLLPPGLPASRTRSELFDDLVLDAVEHLEHRWQNELGSVEFAVEDVPPVDAPDGPAASVGDAEVPLARLYPARSRTPARIVVYRRPLEARAQDPLDLADLVHDVVVEQVAQLLGLDPDTVDGVEGYDE
jgi:predicted Zn-dependent protease with MMP-like domain